MSEETRASLMDNPQQECISKVAATDVEELPFRCPACGGQQLSYGLKSYQKAVIHADGEMEFYGGDSFGEDDVDFACWDCGHVISENGEPIRRPEDMVEWLKTHGGIENDSLGTTQDNCISLRFTCPECGGHELIEHIERGEEVHTPITQVTFDPESENVELDYDYDEEWSRTKWKEDHYWCADCKYLVVNGGKGALAEWLMENCEQAPESKENAPRSLSLKCLYFG